MNSYCKYSLIPVVKMLTLLLFNTKKKKQKNTILFYNNTSTLHYATDYDPKRYLQVTCKLSNVTMGGKSDILTK